jgi:hypothetical protein
MQRARCWWLFDKSSGFLTVRLGPAVPRNFMNEHLSPAKDLGSCLFTTVALANPPLPAMDQTCESMDKDGYNHMSAGRADKLSLS